MNVCHGQETAYWGNGDTLRRCVCTGGVWNCCTCLVCSQIRHPHHGAVENGQEVSELLQEKKTALNPNKAEIPTPNKKKSEYPMVVSFLSCKRQSLTLVLSAYLTSILLCLSLLQSYSQPTQNSPPSGRRYSYVPETLVPSSSSGRKQSPPDA